MSTTTEAPLPAIEQWTPKQRDELLGRLAMDAFARNGVLALPVEIEGAQFAVLLPHIQPAKVTTIPEMPPGFLEEIKRRAATPEDAVDWSVMRERLAANLQKMAPE